MIGTMLCTLLRIPQLEGGTGDAAVQDQKGVLRDHRRSREIPVSVWAPAEEGAYPRVVISHGMGETGESYAWLGRALASRRFWVVAPTHPGSDRAVLEHEGIRGIVASTRRPETWRNRFQDVSFLLDAMEREGNLPLQPLAARGPVAVAGHSAGALTACALGGLQLGSVNFRDPRVEAIISMSMPRLNAVIAAEAWATVSVPALHITGTLDVSPQYWTFPRHRRTPFENAAARGDQFLVTLRGATHSTYSVPAGDSDNPQKRLQQCVATISGLFLDGWLLQREDARGRFQSTACDGVRLENR